MKKLAVSLTSSLAVAALIAGFIISCNQVTPSGPEGVSSRGIPPSLNAVGPLTGAIFTTDQTCTGVNLNIYGNKDDVYIDGGPRHPGAAGLPDGYYCVQVTDPSGATVLGLSAAAAVHVTNGEFDQCYQLSAILKTGSSGFTVAGYDDTPNNGGEYKVWVSPDCDFVNSQSKTDNFKVKSTGGGPPPSAKLCVKKFYDANANGLDDDNQEITGWLVRIYDGIDIIRTTPVCVIVDPDDYTVTEADPLEPSWMHTTPTSVNVTLANGDEKSVAFGNLCLGAGGGLTLGFWSNKNGQALITAGQLCGLNGLWLRNANGSNFDPVAACPPSNSQVNTGKTNLKNWLLAANATNMANMLSAQLAAMYLNVANNKVSGSSLVYAGSCGNTGIDSKFISINDLIAAANAELLAHPVTTSGSPYRAAQECLKNALDKANNNLNFVQQTPCAYSFPE